MNLPGVGEGLGTSDAVSDTTGDGATLVVAGCGEGANEEVATGTGEDARLVVSGTGRDVTVDVTSVGKIHTYIGITAVLCKEHKIQN